MCSILDAIMSPGSSANSISQHCNDAALNNEPAQRTTILADVLAVLEPRLTSIENDIRDIKKVVVEQGTRIEMFMVDMENASKKNTEMMSLIVMSAGSSVQKKKGDITTNAYAEAQGNSVNSILSLSIQQKTGIFVVIKYVILEMSKIGFDFDNALFPLQLLVFAPRASIRKHTAATFNGEGV